MDGRAVVGTVLIEALLVDAEEAPVRLDESEVVRDPRRTSDDCRRA
jgi:hypothetical protein